MILLSNAYIPPLMSLFDPFYFLKIFRKWRMERQQKKGHSIVTQSEANELLHFTFILIVFKISKGCMKDPRLICLQNTLL